MHPLQVLAKQVFAVEDGAAVATVAVIAMPGLELQVLAVDVAFPFVLGGEGLVALRKVESALELASLGVLSITSVRLSPKEMTMMSASGQLFFHLIMFYIPYI